MPVLCQWGKMWQAQQAFIQQCHCLQGRTCKVNVCLWEAYTPGASIPKDSIKPNLNRPDQKHFAFPLVWPIIILAFECVFFLLTQVFSHIWSHVGNLQQILAGHKVYMSSHKNCNMYLAWQWDFSLFNRYSHGLWTTVITQLHRQFWCRGQGMQVVEGSGTWCKC